MAPQRYSFSASRPLEVVVEEEVGLTTINQFVICRDYRIISFIGLERPDWAMGRHYNYEFSLGYNSHGTSIHEQANLGGESHPMKCWWRGS